MYNVPIPKIRKHENQRSMRVMMICYPSLSPRFLLITYQTDTIGGLHAFLEMDKKDYLSRYLCICDRIKTYSHWYWHSLFRVTFTSLFFVYDYEPSETGQSRLPGKRPDSFSRFLLFRRTTFFLSSLSSIANTSHS